jgi:prefoldin alpha subunit
MMKNNVKNQKKEEEFNEPNMGRQNEKSRNRDEHTKSGNNIQDDEGLYNTLQQKYMEYQALEQQSRQVSDQIQKISEQLYEIEFIKQSLEEYNKVKEGTEMLSPISSGIFVKAKVAESDSFYVNVGSNVVVKKNLEQTKELMKKQGEQLKSAHEKLVLGFEDVNSKLQALESDLMKLSGQ